MLELRATVTRRGAKNLEFETLFGEIPLDKHGKGGLHSRFPASEIDFYAARLLTLGADIVVEAPQALIDVLRAMAKEVVGLYSPSHEA